MAKMESFLARSIVSISSIQIFIEVFYMENKEVLSAFLLIKSYLFLFLSIKLSAQGHDNKGFNRTLSLDMFAAPGTRLTWSFKEKMCVFRVQQDAETSSDV